MYFSACTVCSGTTYAAAQCTSTQDTICIGMIPEPPQDKTGKIDYAQPIRVFAVRMKKARVLSYPLSAQQRLWSDWADAQADLSLRWAHSHFVAFVTMRLTLFFEVYCKNLKNLDTPKIAVIMSPTEGEGDILFLVRILLAPALALASASAWQFLGCTMSHEPVGGF